MALFGFMKRNRTIKQLDKLHAEKNFEQAWQLLNPLLEASPNDPLLLLHAGVHAYEKADLDQSKSYIEKALKLQEDNPVLHLAMGEILYRKKQYQASIAMLKTSLELSPGNPRSEYLLGLNHIALGELEEASYHFEVVSREDRDFLLARLLTLGESMLMKATN